MNTNEPTDLVMLPTPAYFSPEELAEIDKLDWYIVDPIGNVFVSAEVLKKVTGKDVWPLFTLRDLGLEHEKLVHIASFHHGISESLGFHCKQS